MPTRKNDAHHIMLHDGRPNSMSVLLASLSGLSAMAVQTELVRLLVRGVPSTNLMTTYATQLAITRLSPRWCRSYALRALGLSDNVKDNHNKPCAKALKEPAMQRVTPSAKTCIWMVGLLDKIVDRRLTPTGRRPSRVSGTGPQRLARCSKCTDAMSVQGFGRVKTQERKKYVERSVSPTPAFSRAMARRTRNSQRR